MTPVQPLPQRRSADSAPRRWTLPGGPGARITMWGVIGAVAVAVGLWAVWDQVPSLSSIGTSLADASPGWLLIAVVAEAVAILAFSMVQRRLVMDLGGRLSRRRSVELTLASGAIASSLPGGSAIGAGYTYRRLRRAGLDKADVGVTMLASSGLLTGALLLMYVALTGPSLLDGLTELIGHRHARMLLLLTFVLLLFAIFRPRQPAEPFAVPAQRDARSVPPSSMFGRAAASIVLLGRSSRAAAQTIPVSSWQAGAVWALTKWAADFAVLASATFAVGMSVDFVSLATVYVGIQALRQIPFTPGGIGVIEAALLAGLIAAGATAAPAAAAVVIYRVLTLWVILPAGAVAAVLDRAPPPARAAAAAA